MGLLDAIYTRQSVERTDSISVESQAEFCKREAVGEEIKLYTDRGYSGKNTDRPAFRELMADMEAGKIRRVIVYRLDRISRSVLDFANVIDRFQKHGVGFVSTMEKFDTDTPIGKAMLMIVMVFAQLERETIQQRVMDAYHSRSRRGFYMGGRVPYGFALGETTIDGVHTRMYTPVPDEVQILRQIFSLYARPQTSLGDIIRRFEECRIRKRDGQPFSRSRIRDIIVNPIYVRADYRLYEFFKSQGTFIANSPEDFIGTNGAYLYSGSDETRKTASLKGHMLVLAPHEGLIDSDIWIKCRSKCLKNKKAAKPLKAKASWLAGKIKCAHCGHALSAKVCRCKTKADNRYYLCGNKYDSGSCPFGSLDADMVDGIVFREMQKKLAEFCTLRKQPQESCSLQMVKLKTRIEEIDEEIGALLDKIPLANGTVMEYINGHIAELDEEKKTLSAKIAQMAAENGNSPDALTGYLDSWEAIPISDRLTVVDSLVESIIASQEKIQIIWKI